MAKKNSKIIPMFLGETVQEYFSIISDRAKFLQMVSEWDRAYSFQGHKENYPGEHRFTYHGSYERYPIINAIALR